jgi:predicted O-methyltransferase YrrM
MRAKLIHEMNTVIELSNLSKQLAPIDGFLHELEGYALLRLAASGPGVGAIVEIGSYLGKSTCWLASGSKSTLREKVTAVDHFKGSPEHQKGGGAESAVLINEGTTFEQFKKNVRDMGLDDYVEPIVAPSAEAVKGWDRPIRLLFIDGDHSYESTKRDFNSWSPFVIPGCPIAFHDVEVSEGVTQVYRELLQGGYEHEFTVASLAVVREKG